MSSLNFGKKKGKFLLIYNTFISGNCEQRFSKCFTLYRKIRFEFQPLKLKIKNFIKKTTNFRQFQKSILLFIQALINRVEHF